MTIAALVPLLVQFLGAVPTILPLVQKLSGDIAAGKGAQSVTPEDMAELSRLAALTGASIYQREGVTLPPPAP